MYGSHDCYMMCKHCSRCFGFDLNHDFSVPIFNYARSVRKYPTIFFPTVSNGERAGKLSVVVEGTFMRMHDFLLPHNTAGCVSRCQIASLLWRGLGIVTTQIQNFVFSAYIINPKSWIPFWTGLVWGSFNFRKLWYKQWKNPYTGYRMGAWCSYSINSMKHFHWSWQWHLGVTMLGTFYSVLLAVTFMSVS
jgi:hypothetical protein